MVYLLKMVIFHSYVSLLEGNHSTCSLTNCRFFLVMEKSGLRWGLGGDRCRLSRGFSKIDPTCKFELQDHIILPSTYIYIYIDIDMYVYNMYICIYIYIHIDTCMQYKNTSCLNWYRENPQHPPVRPAVLQDLKHQLRSRPGWESRHTNQWWLMFIGGLPIWRL